MVITEVLNLIADHWALFVPSLLLSIVISLSISYFMIRRLFSGMLISQLAFVCNFTVIIFLTAVDYLSYARFAHFAFFEIFVTACMFMIYRNILVNRIHLMSEINQLPRVKLAIVVSFLIILMIVLNQYVVPDDGSSRIGYMTYWWFSYLRLVITIISPLGYFFAINLLESKKYILSLILTSALIVQNATAGSKAGFIVGLLGMLMLHRDLNNSKIKIIRVNPFWAVAIVVFVLSSALFVLDKMGVGFYEIAVRLLMHAEATIMVYLAADSTEACYGLTLFAALHRGFARLFGDPSANNIDTLFGFALSAVHYGANTLTGPNSSIPAYFSCNFPGIYGFFGGAVILLYVAIVKYFLKIRILVARNPAVWLLPFIVTSINTFPQDYYTGMSDLTLILIISTFYFFAMNFAYSKDISNPKI